MTAYRIDEFESDDDEFEVPLEGREDPVLVTEEVAPKSADTTKRVETLEVNVDKALFKTKCQLMQEEIRNGL